MAFRLRGPHLLTLLTALWLLTFLRPTLSNGDAACYLSQLREGDLSSRTIHLGYLLAAFPAVRWLPLEPALRLNLFSVGWGLVVLAGLWRLERRVSPERLPGLAPLWWLACAPVLEALTTAEIYPMQLALLLWAVVSWGAGRPVVAGLLWWGAMAVSPSSVAALPAFVYHAADRRAWVKMLAAGLMPMACMVGLVAEDWLWGPRGLLQAPAGMSLLEALFRRLEALPATLGWGTLLLGPGLLAATSGRWPAGRRLLLATGAQAVVVWLLVDRYADVPAQGLTLTLLTLFVAEGSHQGIDARPAAGGRRLAWAVGGLLLWQLFVSDQAVRSIRRKELAFAALCRRVAATLPPEGRVVGSFSERRLFEWYAVGRAPVEGLTLEPAEAWNEGDGLGVGPPRRFLRAPEPGWLPAGTVVRLEADGGWTVVSGPEEAPAE